jgi:hypothetical protein
MAIFIQQKVKVKKGTDPEKVIAKFEKLLEKRQLILDDYKAMRVREVYETARQKKTALPKDEVESCNEKMVACPVLEVGSILSLIYIACQELGLPVFESDILQRARDNSIQFLSVHR